MFWVAHRSFSCELILWLILIEHTYTRACPKKMQTIHRTADANCVLRIRAAQANRTKMKDWMEFNWHDSLSLLSLSVWALNVVLKKRVFVVGWEKPTLVELVYAVFLLINDKCSLGSSDPSAMSHTHTHTMAQSRNKRAKQSKQRQRTRGACTLADRYAVWSQF